MGRGKGEGRGRGAWCGDMVVGTWKGRMVWGVMKWAWVRISSSALYY